MSSPNRPSQRRLLPWLGAAVLLLALPAVAGELYQWKDANGVTHYSDSPPPKGSYKNRTITTAGAASVASETAAAAPVESSQCSTARGNLALLSGDGAVGTDEDGDGKPDTTMTPEQRGAQRQLAEAAIKVHCKAVVASTSAS